MSRIVNVSSVQDFMQCRYRWACKWVHNRVPRKDSEALEIGKAIHRIFEKNAQEGLPLQDASKEEIQLLKDEMPGLAPWQRETAEGTLAGLQDLHEAWPLWRDTYPMDVAILEAEHPFMVQFPVGDGTIVTFRGRPDRVCIMAGQVWHVQNRGLASGMNFGTYVRLAKRHFHEHLYAEYLSSKYAKLGDYGGTLFNLVRKLKFHTNVGKKNEKTKTAADMFWQHPMSVRLDSPNHREVMSDLFYHVVEMRRVEEQVLCGGRLPAPNDKLNGGYGGNSEDPFFKLKLGEIRLDDDKWFKDREDTYATDTVPE